MLSYASVTRGERVPKLVTIQRTYRKRFQHAKVIRLKREARQYRCAQIIRDAYLLYKKRKYIQSRETLPSLPMELWRVIFANMDRRSSVPFRSLSTEFSSEFPSRLKGVVCGLCENEAFLPVCLRFRWWGSSIELGGHMDDLRVFSCGSHSFERRGALDEFCKKNENSMYCLRCARDFLQAQRDEDPQTYGCPHGCCWIYTNRALPLHEKYGDWPRRPADPPHKLLYRELDALGIGTTRCPRCATECGSLARALDHVRNTCPHRRHKDRKLERQRWAKYTREHC